MLNLNFDDGFRRFSLNGDENKVIKFSPADFGIIERIKDAYDMIEDGSKFTEDVELKTDGTPMEELGKAAVIVKGLDDTIKNAINHIFNSDVSSMVFDKQSPLSMVGGVPFYERFLDAIIPVIKKEFKAEQVASQKRISKYTQAYHK